MKNDALNRVRRESEDFTEESSTIESSVLPDEDEEEDSSNNHVVTILPMLQLPQNPPQDFNSANSTSTSTYDSTSTHVYDENNKYQYYSPSHNPNAQFISITHKPIDSYEQPQPMKSYYDFYPSQPDIFHQNNYVPLCLSHYVPNKFAPIIYGNSGWNYINHHQQQQSQQNYYQFK